MSAASSSRQGIWAPLLARLLAGAVALLGLAGIGFAASRSPELLLPGSAPPAAQLAASLSAPLGTGPSGALAGAAGAGALPAAPRPCICPPAAPAEAAEVEPRAAAAEQPRAATAEPAGSGPGLAPDGRVILNLASLADLQRLPGIGARRAAEILQLRTRLGRFRRVEELLRIKGIGPRMLERLAPRVLLDPPAVPAQPPAPG